jgi:GTP pyrophosphokinase
MGIEELIARFEQNHPQDDSRLVREAYNYAARAHQGQQRLSGEEYVTHPLAVAAILTDLQLDAVTVAAGLLHDVVEDTSRTLEDIESVFGPEIAMLVDGVTKLGRLEYSSKMEQQVENLRKMFMAMAKDIRVILIKLADRLHNMRTLTHHSRQKQREIAQETLDIFAPLAHRLGIFRLKSELEDLSLRYLEPECYYDLSRSISMKRSEREAYINQVIEIMRERLDELGIKADISGRAKHFYSIYNKMIKRGAELGEIYDLIAVR